MRHVPRTCSRSQ